jgi:OOP family OmpA-OmpF porin
LFAKIRFLYCCVCYKGRLAGNLYISKLESIMVIGLKKISLALALAAVLASPAMACMSGNDNLVVNDVRGHVVRDVRGNCVYTKWTNGDNRCDAPAARADAAPVASGKDVSGLALSERTIYFGFDSAVLSQESVYKLNKLIAKIKDTGKDTGKMLSASIVGHADQMGDVGYNQSLSARRANAVKNYLVANGLKDAKVASINAVGEQMPVTKGCEAVSGKNAINCLQPDRRVEVNFLLK